MKNLFLIAGLFVLGITKPALAQDKTPYVQQIFKITPENFYVGISPSFTPKPNVDDFTLEQLSDFQSGMIDATLTLDIISKWKVTIGVGLLTGQLNAQDYAELSFEGDEVDEFWNNYESIGEEGGPSLRGVFGSNILPNFGISRPIKLGNIHVTPSVHFWLSDVRFDNIIYAREDLNTGQIIEEIVSLREDFPLAAGTGIQFPTFGLNVELNKYIIGIQINDPIYGINMPDFGVRFGYKL